PPRDLRGVSRPTGGLGGEAIATEREELGLRPAGLQPSQDFREIASRRPVADLMAIAAEERRLAGEDLAEDRAQGEDVGPLVDLVPLAARLLGGHVRQCG